MVSSGQNVSDDPNDLTLNYQILLYIIIIIIICYGSDLKDLWYVWNVVNSMYTVCSVNLIYYEGFLLLNKLTKNICICLYVICILKMGESVFKIRLPSKWYVYWLYFSTFYYISFYDSITSTLDYRLECKTACRRILYYCIHCKSHARFHDIKQNSLMSHDSLWYEW